VPGKGRMVFRIVGVGSDVHYGVHDNNLCNAERAVLERVMFVKTDGEFHIPYQPDGFTFRSRVKGFREKLIRGVGFAAPISSKEFAGLYRGPRQRRYELAEESLMFNPLQRKDSYLTSFIKAEKTNFTAKPESCPRLIQPRSARYNVEVGRYLKPLEHELYLQIDKVFGDDRSLGEYTVMKGLNSVEVAMAFRRKWDSFRDPVAIGMDASRFDQHVSRVALEWEHSIYNTVFRSGYLRKILRWQVKNTGFIRLDDGTIKYTTTGTRCSGDMNTGSGNCIIMCALVYAYLESIGVSGKLANNGDDCVVMIERGDLDKFNVDVAPWFKEMGFKMEVESAVDQFEKIVFCQAQPVWNGESFVMVRDPRTAMAKDSTSVLPLDSAAKYSAWRLAVGECGLAINSGVPVCQEYFSAFIRGAEPLKNFSNQTAFQTGMWHLAQRLEVRRTQVTTEARISFYEAFGLLPDHQILLEKEFEATDLRPYQPFPDVDFNTFPHRTDIITLSQ